MTSTLRASKFVFVCLTAALLSSACDDETPKTALDTSSDSQTVDVDTDTDSLDSLDTQDLAEVEDTTPPARPTCALTSSTSAPETHTLNGWTVEVDSGTGAWSITPPGGTQPTLEGSGTCVDGERGPQPALTLVREGAPKVLALAGAYQIQTDSGLTWWPTSGVAPTVTASESLVSLRWALLSASNEADFATLIFEPYGPRDLRIALQADGGALGGSIEMRCTSDESFFGLGTQSVGMDLRGHEFPLWTQEQGVGKPKGGGIFPLNNIPEAAYAPMGVWHSSRGYSALLDTDAYSELNLCENVGDRVRLRTYGELPALVLVAGDSPRARLSAITDYTGRPTEPAPWLLAPWNDAVGGPENLHRVAAVLRDNHIPSSAIWSEDWIGGDEGNFGFRLSYAWEWDPTLYPDLPTDIDTLHDDGFAFLAYFNPFVPQPTRMYQEGVDGGYLIETADAATYVFSDPAGRMVSLVDLSNPGAVAWLSSYLDTAANTLKIDGWMADYAEWLPIDSVLFSNESPWLAHNRYPLEWQRVNREALSNAHAAGPEPANNWVYFPRSGWASTGGGTGGIAPTMWAGDQNTDWEYDDGFPTVVAIGSHVGLSGVSLYGSDIAGYSAFLVPPTTKELFLRWSAFGAFSPLMRTHHGSSECTNWAFDRDPATLEHYKRYAIIHTLLYPYLSELTQQASATGLPLMRHPFLVEPNCPTLWSGDHYSTFLGDHLLVVPVLAPAVTQWEVTLPAAGWWPLFGDAPQTDGTLSQDGALVFTADASPTEIPVYVRPGTVLALLDQPVDSFYGATNPALTTLADVTDAYRLALYPDASGALRSSAVGAATVVGEGWSQVDLTSAPTLDGTPLLPCADVAAGTSCVDAETVWIVGTDLVLRAQGATLTFASPIEQSYRVGLAGLGWGEWRRATDPGDLNAVVTPPCELP
ncbi:MAG: hypothetical protein CO108_09835 [Deltaproteobacteria bacterium CG_4_9_14_3_um_filter_63_12]|nr:MAG: hypothetical protein CO108_09835 [Deltaproteobacteria bacterium CG_4_9_14_3_um_filter_63_12]